MKTRQRDDESLTVYKNRKTLVILGGTVAICLNNFREVNLSDRQDVLAYFAVHSLMLFSVLIFLWAFRKLTTMADRDAPWL